MTANLRGCFAVLAASVLVLGCADPQAASQRDVQKKYQAALEKIAQANRGFTDGQPGKVADVAEFRARLLAQAAAELDGLVGQGLPGQQAAAARALGQTSTALAMHQTQLAQAQWSTLWHSTSELLQKATLAAAAQMRTQTLDVNQEPGLEQLSQYKSRFTRQAQEAQARAAALTASLADLQARHQALQAQRDELFTQVQALDQKAFALSGQAQFETYQAALAARRQAQILDAQAETLAAEIGVLQAEQNLARQTAQLAAAQAQEVEAQSQSLAQRQRQTAAQRQAMIGDDQAPSSVKSRERALAELLDQVMQTYSQQVQPAFDRADQSAAKGLVMLEKSLSLAGNDASLRRSLQADLLAAYVTRLQVKSRWIAAQGNLARVLAVADARLADAATLGDTAQGLRRQIAEFQQSLARAVEESLALRTKSMELSGQLSTPGAEPNALSAFVAAQNQRIAQAVTWIETSRM